MADVFTQAKRSQVMSRIRGRGNKETELALVGLFRRHGITGWRRHWQIRNPKSEIRYMGIQLTPPTPTDCGCKGLPPAIIL